MNNWFSIFFGIITVISSTASFFLWRHYYSLRLEDDGCEIHLEAAIFTTLISATMLPIYIVLMFS